MEITTVKLHRKTKHALDKLKFDHESYDRVVDRLISQVKKKSLKKELIEAYKSMGPAEMEEFNEWEAALSEL